VAEDVAELCIGHVRRGLPGTDNNDDVWAARVPHSRLYRSKS
jgi:hypothetical protein